MRNWPLLITNLVANVMFLATGSAATAQSIDSTRIDEFVLSEMTRQQIPGVAVGVVVKGEVVKARGYGMANLEHRVPVASDTLFESASVGKQFTATAVMLQVEDGKLALTDPLTRFFPNAPDSWRSITVRHLLTHTSGIPDYSEERIDYRKDYSEDDLVKIAESMPLEFKPGARWSYSNTGYVLLGIIIHKVSGSFYGDVLADRVFKPLGMTTARIISEADIVLNRAAGYRLESGQVKNQDWVAPSLNTTADGSLYLSVNDLIAWDKGLRSRAILSPASWDQVLQPVRLNSGKSYPYGFGWFIDERNGEPLYQHSGSWQGFKTHIARFIGEDLSVIVLCNLAQADPQRIVDGITAIARPVLAVPTPVPIEDQEPHVTARVIRLLEQARAGTLRPGEFAYWRAGSFEASATRLRARLRELGDTLRVVLVRRADIGDDREFVYELKFTGQQMYLRLLLTPEDRVSDLELLAP